jgi:hypothetical protein
LISKLLVLDLDFPFNIYNRRVYWGRLEQCRLLDFIKAFPVPTPPGISMEDPGHMWIAKTRCQVESSWNRLGYSPEETYFIGEKGTVNRR